MILELIESTANTIGISLVNLFIPAIIFLLLALLVKGKGIVLAIRQSFPNSVFNIALMTLNIVIITPLILLLSQWMNVHNFPTLDSTYWEYLPNAFVIVCAVFFGDFIGYWRHRLEHSWFLWPAHSVHHSDTQMTWLTLQRFHPINRLSTYIIDTSFLLVLGFPPYAIIANTLVRHYYGYFIHADLPWTYGKWGNLFVSPVMHRWHHAVDTDSHNTNFATVFSIFDRCFGTYRVTGQCLSPLGVRAIADKWLFDQLLYPFRLNSYKNNLRNTPVKN